MVRDCASAPGRLDLVRSVDGRVPRWPTSVSLSWNEEALFVRFECRDDLAWATHRRRDAPLWQEEVAEVFLAPADVGADGELKPPQRYFELEVNPLGALFDAEVHNPDGDRATMRVDTDWDWAGIQWRVGRCDGQRSRAEDWWAELELPWRGLGAGISCPPTGLWAANFYRVERPAGVAGPLDEYSAWSPTGVDPPDFHRPKSFGVLRLDGAPGADRAVVSSSAGKGLRVCRVPQRGADPCG